jgi:hypothetical protein
VAEWTHRICERCWFDGTDLYRGMLGSDPVLAPPGMLEDGTYRQPVQVKEPDPGACCICGGMTITGIYFRHDERELLCQGEHEDLRWSRVGVE